MKITKAKYYPESKQIVPIKNDLTLLGEKTNLEKARDQKGVDEHYEEWGKFTIIDIGLTSGDFAQLEIGKKTETTINEDEWNTL